jgi:cell division protein FtsI (penicillin-binding protein 3)
VNTRTGARRLIILLCALMVALGGVVIRLGLLQVRDSGQFAAMGEDQRLRRIELPAERGRIVDRSMAPLAITVSSRDVYVDPSQVVDAKEEAGQIAEVLGVRPAEILPALESDGTFAYIARRVDDRVAHRLMSMGLPGLNVLPVPKRDYPSGPLAAQVLGFVGTDGYGLSGLEAAYDDDLAGAPGLRTVEVSQFGEPIPTALDTVEQSVPGSDVATTLDRQIQYQAQLALRRAVGENQAKGGSVIVMDVHTGEIYAMATWPGFNPNHFGDFDSDRYRNRALSDVFEPGSTNKVITAATAIDTGAVSLTERFSVPWATTVDGSRISDSHQHATMSMTIGDIIAQSSNIGASEVAERIGSDRLASYLARFGYGVPTGVGFPGEASGVLPPLEWSDLTRSTVSFGVGVSVSALQMTSVYQTIANGGVWVQPRIVRGTVAPDGVFHDAPAPARRRVVKASTADLVSRMLAYVVEDGTGTGAQIPGYQVAGKTGTSRKVVDGRYVHRYMASFIGFLPAREPRIVVAAILDEPTTVFGGIAAAPLFQHVARYTIQRLGIAPAPVVRLPPHLLATA